MKYEREMEMFANRENILHFQWSVNGGGDCMNYWQDEFHFENIISIKRAALVILRHAFTQLYK